MLFSSNEIESFFLKKPKSNFSFTKSVMIQSQSTRQYKQIIRRQNINLWYNPKVCNKQTRIKIILDYLLEFAKTLQLKPNTFILGVHIMDVILSKFKIKEHLMVPISLVSLQIASKFSELKSKIINYKDMNKYILNYRTVDYAQVEKLIMKNLNYQVNILSPNKILKFLLNEFINGYYTFFEGVQYNANTIDNFLSIVSNLHFLTLLEYDFYQYSSATVAICIIILSRYICHLDPWTEKMKKFTNFSLKQMGNCLNLLRKVVLQNNKTILIKKNNIHELGKITISDLFQYSESSLNNLH